MNKTVKQIEAFDPNSWGKGQPGRGKHHSDVEEAFCATCGLANPRPYIEREQSTLTIQNGGSSNVRRYVVIHVLFS